MGLSSDSMWLIPSTVFLAGLIGSPHCASMCGPLVVNFANKRKHLAAYQLGRLISYSCAGALIGAFGENIFGSTKSSHLTIFSLLFMALLLFVNAYRTFFNRSLHFQIFGSNSKIVLIKSPIWFRHLNQKIWQTLRTMALPRIVFASLAGILTIFLPCGHLYSFMLGAVATGSAAKGALYMAAFWLGSAPLLSVGASWMRQQLLPSSGSRQKWAGGLLLVAGIFSIIAFGLRIPTLNAMTSQRNLQENMKAEIQHELRCH